MLARKHQRYGSKQARPPAWEHQATPGQWGTRRRSRLRWGTPAPGLHRRLQRPIRQNSKGNKASEYLVYPRVLRPATKFLCMYQMERGGCIVDCNIEIQG